MAKEALRDRFFRKVFRIWVRPSTEKSENNGNRTSARGIGHLLVQNSSQEVREYFGHKEKAKKAYKKLESRILGLGGLGGLGNSRSTASRPLLLVIQSSG